jgi:hypothetical protein
MDMGSTSALEGLRTAFSGAACGEHIVDEDDLSAFHLLLTFDFKGAGDLAPALHWTHPLQRRCSLSPAKAERVVRDGALPGQLSGKKGSLVEAASPQSTSVKGNRNQEWFLTVVRQRPHVAGHCLSQCNLPRIF